MHGLGPEDDPYTPSDVQRATQIFDKPSFFVEGADSNDIVQGKMGDCWFLSALSTMSTAKGLVEKFCVAVGTLVSNSVHLLTRTGHYSGTSRLECTASSFSEITHGLLLSLTSKSSLAPSVRIT